MSTSASISKQNELKLIRKVTMVGFWINAVLVVVKLFFGYWGHSDALVADGYHSFSDFITDFMVLFFVGIAYKQADKEHPYGHGKYETIASVFIAVVLLLVAFGIGWGGITTIIGAIKGETIPKPDVWTIIVACLSIVLKEFCYRYTMRYAVKIDSSALKANAWHHRTDAISSIATLIGVTVAYTFGTVWRIIDPIASIVIAVFIGISAVNIAKPSINELLEISLPLHEIEEIHKLIKSVPGVLKVHNLRGRRNGHSIILDVNIHVDPNIPVRAGHLISLDVEKCLHKQFGKDMIIYVHIEPEESGSADHEW